MEFQTAGDRPRLLRPFTRPKIVPHLLILLWLVPYGCAALQNTPKSSESSMLMGRVLINSAYRGRYGLLPLGLQAQKIQVEVRSDDGERVARESTDSEGYFFMPELPPGDYYWRSVTVEVFFEKKSDSMRFPVQFLKIQVRRAAVTYSGTLLIEVSKEGEFHFKELGEPDKAQQHLAQSFEGTRWPALEFISTPPSSAIPPPGKLPTIKKDTPGLKGNPARPPR
jgi:hypothetical protein